MKKVNSKKKSNTGSSKKASRLSGKVKNDAKKKKKAVIATASVSKSVKPVKKEASAIAAHVVKKVSKPSVKKVSPKNNKKKGVDWDDSFDEETEKVDKNFEEGEDDLEVGEEEPTKLDDFNFEVTPEEEEEEGFFDETF